jgi:hypothetical protein
MLSDGDRDVTRRNLPGVVLVFPQTELFEQLIAASHPEGLLAGP